MIDWHADRTTSHAQKMSTAADPCLEYMVLIIGIASISYRMQATDSSGNKQPIRAGLAER